jgi:hypothetical protein
MLMPRPDVSQIQFAETPPGLFHSCPGGWVSVTVAAEAERLEITEKIIAAFKNLRPHYDFGGIVQQLFATLWRHWAARILILFAVAVVAMGGFNMPDIGRQWRSASWPF